MAPLSTVRLSGSTAQNLSSHSSCTSQQSLWHHFRHPMQNSTAQNSSSHSLNTSNKCYGAFRCTIDGILTEEGAPTPTSPHCASTGRFTSEGLVLK